MQDEIATLHSGGIGYSEATWITFAEIVIEGTASPEIRKSFDDAEHAKTSLACQGHYSMLVRNTSQYRRSAPVARTPVATETSWVRGF